MLVSPLSRSGARHTVPVTETPPEAARPLPAQGSGNLDHDLGAFTHLAVKVLRLEVVFAMLAVQQLHLRLAH